MNQGNYQNYPTTIIKQQPKYVETIYLPPEEYQTYSTPIIYDFNSQGQYYQHAQTKQTKTTTTKTTTVTNYSPHTIYYSNEQYFTTPNNNNIKYTTNTYTQGIPGQTIITTQTRKTAPGYEYQQIKEKLPHIQKVASEESELNINNITYPQRKTNYHKANNLNLNQIYNMSNPRIQKTNIVNDPNKIKNINVNNASNINTTTYDYNYYNNNMFMVDSSNISNQKQKNQIAQKNVDPNKYYYNNYINQQQKQTVKTNKNAMPQKQNVNVNVNYANNANITNTKTNTNIHTNVNSQTKTTTNNQTNAYHNNKIIINNKKNTHHQVQNYKGYPIQQNVANVNNIYDGYLQEPPDNMRNKKRNNNDPFNKTMPNLRIKQDITTGAVENVVKQNASIDRKSNPLQVISNFEISFNNTPPTKNKNNTKINNNNVPVTTNNINITDNNQQSAKIPNKEYKDKYGNIYLLINGNYVLKSQVIQNTVVNKTTNVNQNQNLQTDKQKVNQNTKTQKSNIEYKNKQDANYENNKITQNQTDVNSGACFDTYTGEVISNKDLNTIKQEFDIPKNDQNNNNFNNTYPLKGQKSYALDNAAYLNQNQNIILNQRENRFTQEPNYVNISTNNNLNYNLDYNYSQQQQQIINNITYKKTKSGTITDNNNNINNDILTVEPQKPKKRRPVYKIPPSKKRAVSQGRSLAFIHKYYDENFIMEEDNENGSDNENKKKNRLKNIFREVTNIRKLLPKWQEMKEKPITNNVSLEQNQNNININNNINNNEQNNKGNIADSLQNSNNNEQINNNMRLSHMKFSLEGSAVISDDTNKDNNNNNNNNLNNNINIENNKKENEQNDNDTNQKIKMNTDNNIDNEESKIKTNSENNQNTNELRSPEKKTKSDTITSSNSKNISLNIEKESVSNSNLSGPRNSDSLLESKTSLENNNNKNNNINTNLENKKSQESHESLKNIDINKSSESLKNIDINKSIEQSNVNETIMSSSIMPNFMEPKENNQDSNLNNTNMDVLTTQIISNNDSLNENDKNENKENDEETRISLNIEAHDLDKYFEKEGVNKRDPKQAEASYSLRTINLENEPGNSQILDDNLEGEDQKKSNVKTENSTNSSNLSGGISKDGSQLPTIDDAIKGSVHLPEKIQNFVSKNNDLYNNYNK